VQPETSDVELRLSDLQTQIDGLNLALQQWRQVQEHAQPMEQRLAQLTEQCAEILNRWTATDVRHSEAVAELEVRLSDWSAIETRLQQDSRERIREMEQTIEHEWQALRRMHEEPVKQLREQAATLGETCVAAANLALRGFERAEARFAALEQDLHGRMNQLSQDLQAAIAEIHNTAAQRQGSLPPASSPFPLESVMRIHDGLRESAEADGEAAAPQFPHPGASAAASRGTRQLPEAASALTERMASLERAVGEATDTAQRTEGFRRTTYAAAALLVLALVVATGFMIRAQSRTEGRLNEAIGRATAAERQANARALADKQTASTRDEAGRQVAEARQAAAQAQTVSTVLTAPDLIRFGLVGGATAPRATAQVLFSRSRGLVVSASRLPQVPAGRAYQLWLLTRTTSVPAGGITVDAAGRATFVAEIPPNLPRPVVGAAVTIEPAGGSPSPTGTMILARAQ
jgi:Anti-sigma-K factor rskA, C-terminal